MLAGWAQAVGWPQVSGLTKLLEGQKEASQGASSRKENRRETWCPGAQGEGDLPHAPFCCCLGHPSSNCHCIAVPSRFEASRSLLRLPTCIRAFPYSWDRVELMVCVTAGGRRRKRNFASHLTDVPEGLEGDSAASESAEPDLASSPRRQRRRSSRGRPLSLPERKRLRGLRLRCMLSLHLKILSNCVDMRFCSSWACLTHPPSARSHMSQHGF